MFKVSVLLFLLATISCSEENINDDGTGTIIGKVVKDGDNNPLENVKIQTTPVSNTVFTDENGEFIIENVLVGEYSVQAELNGFITAFKPSRVIAGEENNVVFELLPNEANNQPPSIPQLISPSENQILESVEAVFSWNSSDPDPDDVLTYSLELRNDIDSEVLIFENITDTSFTYSPLLFGAKYFWQVTVEDGINDPVNSSIGSFEVLMAPIDNRILFTRQINDNNIIFSANIDGEAFQLTSQENNSYRPRRNVAANKIAYFQSNGAQVDIYTMNRDGSEKFKVTSSIKPGGFNQNEINFSWPENSDKIYFPNFDKLYRINTNGQGLELIYQTQNGAFISEVDVNQAQEKIALKTNDQNGYNVNISVIDFSGTLIDTVLEGVSGAASGINISFDGQSVLYSYDASGNENGTYRRLDSRAFIYSLSDSSTTDVSLDKPGGTNDLDVRFSPNEAEIIFTNTSNDGISQKDIWKLTIGEDQSRTLLFSNGFMPDWE